jgi:hypothetical protein
MLGRSVRFFAVVLVLGGGLALFVPAAGAAAGLARAIPSRLLRRRWPGAVAAAGMEDRHSRAAGERLRRAARVPSVLGQGLDPAEPVIYLPWANAVA